MTVATHHIRRMLSEAESLARRAEQDLDSHEQRVRCLERAANHARHAAAELEDEMLRLRDGWPVV